MNTAEKIIPPAYALRAIELLEKEGFEAWFVGGCVRDAMLGRPPEDWDITTSALPRETAACFQDFPCIDTGLKHGTVTAVLENHPVEITTFRFDGVYTDHRRPETVEFSKKLEDDLSRRDFTINAMAYHPERGLIDPFHGLFDLEKRILRCVGDPVRRFSEDALRILRCLRFSAVLELAIDPATAAAVRSKKELLLAISHERVREELHKLLLGNRAAPVLREYAEVLFTVLPELASMKGCAQETPYHRYDVWEHTLHALADVPKEPVLRWAALFHDCGKPAVKFFSPDGTAHFYGHEKESLRIAWQCLLRLRFSKRESEQICTLITRHGEPLPISEKRLKRLLGELGEEQLFSLFALMHGDLAAQAPKLYEERSRALEAARALTEKLLQEEECLTLRDLAVNGSDLNALGIPPGPRMGEILRALLEQVLDGACPNEKDDLLRQAEGLYLSRHKE